MTSEGKFWLVACTDTIGNLGELLERKPSYMHRDMKDAEKEALRLARVHEGKEFAVVEAVAAVTAGTDHAKWVELK